MTVNAGAGEKLALVGTIDPQTVANTELFTDVVDMSKFHQVLATAFLGNMAAETIDFKAYTCNSDGSGATQLKAATQLAAHASNNDNKQIAIQVRADELGPLGKQYVKFGLVTGGATGGPAAVSVVGVDGRYQPEVDNDLSSVAEIKT
ncbi:MAG TPA: hypothetical protein VEC35_01315 [Noviherbaspirillum sp.]|nr:hypothetical protein [Noviherbaspirillum sp.]